MCVAAPLPSLSPLYLPRMGHLCDVPCKILQLLASERARSNFDASLTRVDSRAGILAPLDPFSSLLAGVSHAFGSLLYVVGEGPAPHLV